MAELTVPVTITYQKPGTQPPLFVAGTFSDPQWVPQPMECRTDEEGKHVFTKSLVLPSNAPIQYKIRVGLGDWWVLNEDAPTVTDDAGNFNNVLDPQDYTRDNKQKLGGGDTLKVPAIASVKELEQERKSSTPIGQVANTASAVADTAEELDADKESTHLETGHGDRIEVEHQEISPLFAHECLGAYDPESEPQLSPSYEEEQDYGRVDYDVDKYDLDDPTLERWPSDRKSVMEAVRKLETCRDENRTSFSGCAISPVMSSKRAQAGEEAIDSSDNASPESSQTLDVPSKQSQGSMASHRSVVSLASIAESDEDSKDRESTKANKDDERAVPPVVLVPSQAAKPTSDALKLPGSDYDEGVVLNGSKSTAKKPPENPFGAFGVETPKPTNDTGKARPDDHGSPDVRVQPPDEIDELEDTGDEADAAVGPPAGRRYGESPYNTQDEQMNLRRRNGPCERSVTPTSFHSNNSVGGEGWFRAFFRVLFVDWIGGFVNRLCGGRRE